MTPEDRSTLDALGLSGRELAAILGKPPSTIHGWGRRRGAMGMQETPREIRLLLDAWARCPEALEAARRTPDAGE